LAVAAIPNDNSAASPIAKTTANLRVTFSMLILLLGSD
jgi:hypothetical protein